MKNFKHIISATIILASSWLMASAQMSTSPYSKLGFGLLNDNATGMQRSMGGVGYAMKGGRIVNVMNPASYADVDSLTWRNRCCSILKRGLQLRWRHRQWQ